MRANLLITLCLALVGCGSDEGTTQSAKAIPAPVGPALREISAGSCDPAVRQVLEGLEDHANQKDLVAAANALPSSSKYGSLRGALRDLAEASGFADSSRMQNGVANLQFALRQLGCYTGEVR